MTSPRKRDEIELVSGRLWAAVYDQVDLPGGGEGWLMLSRGLWHLGQKELVFVCRALEPGLPSVAVQTISTLFTTVYGFAEQGNKVDHHGFTALAEGQQVSINPRITGFLYRDRVNLPLPIPSESPALLVVPLLAGETRTAMEFGHARVLTLLGKQAGSYPFPWWFDGQREPVADADAQAQQSMLNRMPRLHTPKITLCQRGQRLRIDIDLDFRGELIATLTQGPGVIALLTDVSNQTLANLVWEPGQSGPMGISRGDGIRPTDPVGGNFLSISHGNVESMAAQREDGFLILLPTQDWKRFTEALNEGRPFGWQVPGDEIRQVDIEFSTEADRGSVVTSPETTRRELRRSSVNVRLESVDLGQNEAYAAESISAKVVASLVERIEQIIDDVLDNQQLGRDRVTVEVSLAPGQFLRPSIASQGGPLPQDVGDALNARLRMIESPPVRQPVSFRACFLLVGPNLAE